MKTSEDNDRTFRVIKTRKTGSVCPTTRRVNTSLKETSIGSRDIDEVEEGNHSSRNGQLKEGNVPAGFAP